MAQLTLQTCPFCKNDRHTFVCLGGPKTSMTVCLSCWHFLCEDMDIKMCQDIMNHANVVIYDI